MTIQQICVHHAETLRVLDSAHTYALRGIRGHALQRRDSGRSSAVNTSRSLRSLRCILKNHREHRGHREKQQTSVLSVSSVVDYPCTPISIMIQTQLNIFNNYIHQS